jgi:hypothetical protein
MQSCEAQHTVSLEWNPGTAYVCVHVSWNKSCILLHERLLQIAVFHVLYSLHFYFIQLERVHWYPILHCHLHKQVVLCPKV